MEPINGCGCTSCRLIVKPKPFIMKGDVWYHKAAGEKYGILAQYALEGTNHVVYRKGDETMGRILDEGAFLETFTTVKPVKYVKGGLYTPKDASKKLTLVYVGNDTFEGLASSRRDPWGASGNHVTQTAPESYWVKNFGELVPVEFCDSGTTGKRGKHVIVQL
jgi:hypothetical protein